MSSYLPKNTRSMLKSEGVTLYCECRSSDPALTKWHFELADPKVTPGGTAGDSSGAPPPAETGETQSPVCRVYAVMNRGNQGGSNNAGTLLVLAKQKLPADPTGHSSSRALFCKIMEVEKVASGLGVAADVQKRNRAECAAAKHFVTAWNNHIVERGYGSYVVGTPFQIEELHSSIDESRRRALCSDAMDPVGDARLGEALAKAGNALKNAPEEKRSQAQLNVLWWTWKSVIELREVGIFHRDLKADNFLSLTPQRESADQEVVQMWIATDLGSACRVKGNTEPSAVYACGPQNAGTGTPYYMSPFHFYNEIEPLHAFLGDSFSWTVMVIEGVLTQCSAGQTLDARVPFGLSAIEQLLGFEFKKGRPEKRRKQLIALLEQGATCSKDSTLSRMRGALAFEKGLGAAMKILRDSMITMVLKVQSKWTRGVHTATCDSALHALPNTMLESPPSISGLGDTALPALVRMTMALSVYESSPPAPGSCV
ncbi:unnamed protein product [Amoebophrya sp. A25]|nr:unnamed protein product [Amoebophrya sp. A25]|eukprot:GSA25T00010756001.1